MTRITPDGIEIDRFFDASPTDVFDAWTTASHFARWFGGREVSVPVDELDYNPIAGSTWSATMVLPDGNTIRWVGEFLEVTPVERLVMTMTDDPASSERSAIVVELAAAEGGTRMHFTQQTPNFTTAQREATIRGWQTFLDELDTGLPARH